MPIVVTTATLLVSGCGASDRARLDVSVDASRSGFPAGWHVAVEESHVHDGNTIGTTRTVPAARGAGSAVFDLHGQGRYRVGVVVEPRDHSTGTGCAKQVYVEQDSRYSARIRLTPDRTCSVVVLHRSQGS